MHFFLLRSGNETDDAQRPQGRIPSLPGLSTQLPWSSGLWDVWQEPQTQASDRGAHAPSAVDQEFRQVWGLWDEGQDPRDRPAFCGAEPFPEWQPEQKGSLMSLADAVLTCVEVSRPF